MFKRFILLFFVVLSVALHASQDTLFLYLRDNDSVDLKKYYEELLESGNTVKIAELLSSSGSELYKQGRYLESTGYFKRAIELFNDLENSKGVAINYSLLANSYYEIGRINTAIELFDKAIAIHSENRDTALLIQEMNNLAFSYYNTYRYKKAIELFHESSDIAVANRDSLSLSQIHYFIGNVYLDENVYDSTIAYYQKSFIYDSITKDTFKILSSLNNLSSLYYKKRDFEKSYDLLQRAIAVSESTQEKMLEAALLNNLGNFYFNKGMYNRALVEYKNSLTKKKASKDIEGFILSIYNIANVYKKLDSLDKALDLLLSQLDIVETMSFTNIASKTYLSISDIYKIKGDDEKSLEYYKKFANSISSFFTEENNDPLAETHDKYNEFRKTADALKKEIEMQKLSALYDQRIKEKEIVLLKNRERIAQNVNAIIIGVLIFIAIIFSFIFLRFKNKKEANQRLEQRNKEIEQQNIIIEEQRDQLFLSNKELEKLSIVASDTDNAVLILDSYGNFEWVNEGYTKLFGYTFDELLSKSPNIVGPDSPDEVAQKLEICINEKKTVQYELNARTKDNKNVWLNVTLTPILDKEGVISRIVCIDSDITGIKLAEQEILHQKEEIEAQKDELQDQRDYILDQKENIEQQKEQLAVSLKDLKEAQKRLVESEKMAALGNLVAGVAHEINTPIGIGIGASSSLLNRTQELDELFTSKKMTVSNLKNYIDSTTQACELLLSNLTRTAELVNSFKQVSVDNMTEQKRSFLLYEYLQNIVRSLAPKLRGRSVELTIDCDETISLNSYPGAFAQIFTNFIINSLLHGFDEGDSGLISIQIIDQTDTLIMIYKDSGKGIPEENIKKVFDPFFTTNMQNGTGLGMNITYNLITQKIGGEIELESTLGEGVCFTITLPKSNIT